MSRVVVVVVSCFLLGCWAPPRPPLTGRVESFELPARAVEETYRIFVRLPPVYDAEPERRFPLIVQLDANLPGFDEFDVTAGLSSQLEGEGRVAPAVVVGVGYLTAREAPLKRVRDFGLPIEDPGFAARWARYGPPSDSTRFYAFLRDELVPHLESTLRLDRQRALFGHSMGGLFTVYALSRETDAAPLFTGFVAASPSLFWDEGQMFTRWKAVQDPAQPRLLFGGVGELEGPEMNPFFDEFADRVRASGFERIRSEFTQYDGIDHVGSVSPSFRDGLLFLSRHGFGGAP